MFFKFFFSNIFNFSLPISQNYKFCFSALFYNLVQQPPGCPIVDGTNLFVTNSIHSEHAGVYARQVSPTPSDVNTGALPILGVQNYATVEIYDDGDAAGVFGFDRSESMSISEKSGEIVFSAQTSHVRGNNLLG